MLKKFEPLPYKFSTKLACEVVSIKPLRLNDAINAKDGYKCAPTTTAGVARVFGEFDLIALFIFRYLTDLGTSQSLASNFSCKLLEAFQSEFRELPDRFDFPLNPHHDQYTGCSADDPTSFTHETWSVRGGKMTAHAALSFNIATIRREVRDRMEFIVDRERNTFGISADQED